WRELPSGFCVVAGMFQPDVLMMDSRQGLSVEGHQLSGLPFRGATGTWDAWEWKRVEQGGRFLLTKWHTPASQQ
ncbi:MAG: hypothetical protein R3212_01615, partial [Xanthomonadales bacterium]|nr:hypothetical protein [Xanthomonadales bacterium]